MNRNVGSLTVLLLIMSLPAASSPQSAARADSAGGAAAWVALENSMAKMHADMTSDKSSGNNDVDFARLMLPHHQAAIDMAKTELLYGKDPQMRRLAQEIVTDQQSETELMHLWLKQHNDPPQK